MYTLLVILIVLTALLMVGIVLIQESKGVVWLLRLQTSRAMLVFKRLQTLWNVPHGFLQVLWL